MKYIIEQNCFILMMSTSKRKILKQKINKLNNDLLKMNFLSMSELNKFIDDIDELLINENTISCIIKKLCELNQYEEAEQYLNYFIEKKRFIPKLRTFSPIIDLLYRNNNLENIILMYNNTRKFNIKISKMDFCKILFVLLNYNCNFYHNLLTDIINYIDILDVECYHILKNNISISNDIKLNKIDIDINLKNKILNHIYKNYLHDVNSKFFDLIKMLEKKKNCEKLIVIDGANIGFYNNRPDKGNKISIHQINMVANFYINIGFDILIILHNRHLKYNKLTNKEEKILNTLKKKNFLYLTPNKFNDDLYWLYSTIYLSQFISVKLVTNDKLRDHIFLIILNQITIYDDNIINYFIDHYIINYDFDNYNNFLPLYSKDFTYSIQHVHDNDCNLNWILPIKNKNNEINLYKINCI